MSRPMRRKDRLVSDFDEMVSIASRARQIIIGMVDDGQPYLVPLDFGYKVHDGILSFYCHSASQGRKIDLMKKNPHISFVLPHSFRIGLGNVPVMWTNAFESVMGEADVVFLEDLDEKLEATQLLMDRYDMGKIPESVYRTLNHMECYRLDVTSMTGKSNLTRQQRDNWGFVESLQRKINDPTVLLSTIRKDLETIEGVTGVEMSYDSDEELWKTKVSIQENVDIREKVFYAMAKANCPIYEMQVKRVSLEDVFLELTEGEKKKSTGKQERSQWKPVEDKSSETEKSEKTEKASDKKEGDQS